MQQVLLVIHLLIALALVGVILIQRSEGGGLGMGGGTGNVMSIRGQANLLTRVTGVLAVCFMATSIVLAILAGGHREAGVIVEDVAPATEAPADAAPGAPTVPTTE